MRMLAWDLIGFGLFFLVATVPTLAAGYLRDHTLPEARYFAWPALGLVLIIAGVFGRRWRSQWRAGH